jgi:pyridoxamine 5'-phosphate oxidase
MNDPLDQLRGWLEEAETDGERWSAAMVLATTDFSGRPAARAVVVREVSPAGLVFFTDERSRKALELAAEPRAAAVLLWPGLGRQARVEGRVEAAGETDADAEFASYSRPVQLALWSVRQGEAVEGREELERRRDEVAVRFPGPVPRPPWWRAYRLGAEAVEFWAESADGLHQRERFERLGPGRWRREVLAP